MKVRAYASVLARPAFSSARLLLLVFLAGCAPGPVASCDVTGFLADQRAHVASAEVTICGTVVRVRPARRTRSGLHRYFWVDVGNGDRIEIDANLDVMGNFPVSDGENAVVHGAYYDDPDGREGIDWTHHSDRGPHPPGFVILNGTTYS